jgi:hypothetical protein
MINKVVSKGTLANPIKLYSFLDAATKSLVTDKGFSHLGPLVSLGQSLKHIGLDHIKFITVPFEAYPPDPNRLQWAPEATQLWQRIKFDKPLRAGADSQVVTAARPSGGQSSSPSSTSTTDPAAVEQAHRLGLCA